MDAIWSITGFFLNSEKESDQCEIVERLRKAAHEAHDLVADGRAAEAATLLRGLLNHVVP